MKASHASPLIDVVAGARPNFIKIASIIRALQSRQAAGSALRFRLVHGVTEEATVTGVPCLTLRDTTERPETVTVGTNELIGTDPSRLKPALDRLFAGEWKKGGIPDKWDGQTSPRIVAALEALFAARNT